MSNEQCSQLGKIIIIGVKGSIGCLIANKIVNAQNIIGIDISEQQSTLLRKNITLRLDNILQPSAVTILDLAHADTIILALSYQVIAAALPLIMQTIKSDCLLVDTLSIKTPFLKLLKAHNVSQQVVGINPMFSGDLNSQGRPVAAIIYRNGAAAENFLQVIQGWDLKIIPMEAHEHDQAMAILQSLGHATLIAFGKVLVASKIDPLLLNTLAPPPFRLLLTLLARLTQNHPDVYWEIQADNPYAKNYRELLQESLGNLEATILAEDKESFNADLGSFNSKLIKELPEFLQLSKQVFDFIQPKNVTDNT